MTQLFPWLRKTCLNTGVTRLKAERIIATLASVDHYSDASLVSRACPNKM